MMVLGGVSGWYRDLLSYGGRCSIATWYGYDMDGYNYHIPYADKMNTIEPF